MGTKSQTSEITVEGADTSVEDMEVLAVVIQAQKINDGLEENDNGIE